MRIHQFVHTLNYGDAISGEAIAISRMLRNRGLKSRIFSVNAHEKVRGECSDWRDFKAEIEDAAKAGEEVAGVLHYSIGSPLNELYQTTPDLRRVLIYHNLTPERWYFGYNSRVVADLRQGRAELPGLLSSSDIVLADSDYNRAELEEAGCRTAQVLPLLIDTEKWSVSANGGIAQAIRGHGGRNILHVGRFAPNKCVEDIIKAFYFYHHKIDKQSKLWLVGSDIDTEIYSFELRRLITELRVDHAVEMVGTVADSELRAFYESCDLYLCMSEHEGFCVPLLEAMHFGLPIIAFASTAVPETLGDGGALIGAKAPAQTAELMSLIINDSALRTRLVDAGKRRVEQFSPAAFELALEQQLVAPLKRTRSTNEHPMTQAVSASCSR